VLAPIFLIRFRKRWVAAFNLAVTNRITSRFAARLPGFGILTHVGRKSGRVYRTPVNVFRAPEGFLIALTYGRESEWVRNVIAAGGCKLETRGVQYQLSAPTIVHDPTRQRFQTVTFWFKDKRLRRRVEVRCSLEEFIDRWAQHIPEPCQHVVRSFGLFAPRALRQTSEAIFTILGQERRPRPKPRPWADSLERDFGRDPLLDRTGKRMKWVRRVAPRVPR
jgi:deazaflavin-dependent oxidoreductase (nitroreductase family)